MKRIYIFVILLAVTVLSGSAQITKFFERYDDVDGVTSVFVSKTMLNMMPNMKTDGMDLSGLAGKVDNIRILTSDNSTMAGKLKKDAKTMINTKEYEELVRVNQGKEKTNIYMKTSPQGINEYLILNEDKSEFNAILITGKLTPADVQKMVND